MKYRTTTVAMPGANSDGGPSEALIVRVQFSLSSEETSRHLVGKTAAVEKALKKAIVGHVRLEGAGMPPENGQDYPVQVVIDYRGLKSVYLADPVALERFGKATYKKLQSVFSTT